MAVGGPVEGHAGVDVGDVRDGATGQRGRHALVVAVVGDVLGADRDVGVLLVEAIRHPLDGVLLLGRAPVLEDQLGRILSGGGAGEAAGGQQRGRPTAGGEQASARELGAIDLEHVVQGAGAVGAVRHRSAPSASLLHGTDGEAPVPSGSNLIFTARINSPLSPLPVRRIHFVRSGPAARSAGAGARDAAGPATDLQPRTI